MPDANYDVNIGASENTGSIGDLRIAQTRTFSTSSIRFYTAYGANAPSYNDTQFNCVTVFR
jgi:hypothetical protein